MKFDPELHFECPEGVYEPAEDSTLLIEIAEVKPGDAVLDMGTGTGIIALHCAKLGANVVAADVNPAAVRCAVENAKMNGLSINAVESNLFGNIDGRFNVILFNPPYLPASGDSSDDIRWTGGTHGYEVMMKFLSVARLHLEPGGAIYTLISSSPVPERVYEKINGLGYTLEVIASRKFFFEELTGFGLCLR